MGEREAALWEMALLYIVCRSLWSRFSLNLHFSRSRVGGLCVYMCVLKSFEMILMIYVCFKALVLHIVTKRRVQTILTH